MKQDQRFYVRVSFGKKGRPPEDHVLCRDQIVRWLEQEGQNQGLYILSVKEEISPEDPRQDGVFVNGFGETPGSLSVRVHAGKVSRYAELQAPNKGRARQLICERLRNTRYLVDSEPIASSPEAPSSAPPPNQEQPEQNKPGRTLKIVSPVNAPTDFILNRTTAGIESVVFNMRHDPSNFTIRHRTPGSGFVRSKADGIETPLLFDKMDDNEIAIAEIDEAMQAAQVEGQFTIVIGASFEHQLLEQPFYVFHDLLGEWCGVCVAQQDTYRIFWIKADTVDETTRVRLALSEYNPQLAVQNQRFEVIQRKREAPKARPHQVPASKRISVAAPAVAPRNGASRPASAKTAEQLVAEKLSAAGFTAPFTIEMNNLRETHPSDTTIRVVGPIQFLLPLEASTTGGKKLTLNLRAATLEDAMRIAFALQTK